MPQHYPNLGTGSWFKKYVILNWNSVVSYELTAVFPEHNCLQLSRLRAERGKDMFSSHWETLRVENKKATFTVWKLKMKPQLLDW